LLLHGSRSFRSQRRREQPDQCDSEVGMIVEEAMYKEILIATAASALRGSMAMIRRWRVDLERARKCHLPAAAWKKWV
jgi:hypothetical protein